MNKYIFYNMKKACNEGVAEKDICHAYGILKKNGRANTGGLRKLLKENKELALTKEELVALRNRYKKNEVYLLCIDESASTFMISKQIEREVNNLIRTINLLNPNSYIYLIKFADTVKDFQLTKSKYMSYIYKHNSGGKTNLIEALRKVYGYYISSMLGGFDKNIIVLTDGYDINKDNYLFKGINLMKDNIKFISLSKDYMLKDLEVADENIYGYGEDVLGMDTIVNNNIGIDKDDIIR